VFRWVSNSVRGLRARSLTEAPKHRNTETPKHRSTEAPKHRSTEAPKHRSTEAPKHRNTDHSPLATGISETK
jgi:hypothetical protein